MWTGLPKNSVFSNRKPPLGSAAKNSLSTHRAADRRSISPLWFGIIDLNERTIYSYPVFRTTRFYVKLDGLLLLLLFILSTSTSTCWSPSTANCEPITSILRLFEPRNKQNKRRDNTCPSGRNALALSLSRTSDRRQWYASALSLLWNWYVKGFLLCFSASCLVHYLSYTCPIKLDKNKFLIVAVCVLFAGERWFALKFNEEGVSLNFISVSAEFNRDKLESGLGGNGRRK